MCQTLTALLQQWVAAQPERTAIINVVGDTVQKMTYGQLYNRAPYRLFGHAGLPFR